MHALAEAFRLFARERELRPLVVRPLAWTVLAYMVVWSLLAWALNALGMRAAVAVQLQAAVGQVVGWLLWGLGLFYLSGVVFVMLAGIISPWTWDHVSMEVEARLTGERRPSTLPMATVLRDSLRRTGFALLMGLIVVLAGCLLPIVGPVLAAGTLAAVDFTGPAFQRRGVELPAQLRRLPRVPGVFGFGFGSGLVALVPLLNVALLPVLVAAGTILVVRAESTPRVPSEA